MNLRRFVFPAAILAVMIPATANASKVVTSPYVNEGVAAVEFRGGYEMDDDNDDSWKTKYQASYGFTSFYDAKLSATYKGAEHTDSELSEIALENKFQLTPKGAYFVDLGARLDYIHNLSGDPDVLSGKILAAKTIGPVANILNVETGRQVGEDSSHDWFYEIDYAGNVEVGQDLRAGIEWYSYLGTLEDNSDEWDEQKHQVGPAIYGTAFGSLKWQVGALAGISEAAPDAMIKTILRYEF